MQHQAIITWGDAMITVIIGARIKSLRNNLGLSQEKLALLANLDRTYLTGVENGARNISVKSLDKIINALGLTWASFFKEVD
jgi:transcriptional regulator with XRE-family HTH domain